MQKNAKAQSSDSLEEESTITKTIQQITTTDMELLDTIAKAQSQMLEKLEAIKGMSAIKPHKVEKASTLVK